jgi:cytochrome c556
MSPKPWILTLAVALSAAAGLAATEAHAADTTLKTLMKKMGAAQSGGDTKSLGPLLTQAKGLAKPEFSDWGTIADQGIKAANAGDLAGAKASCKSCHDKYKREYKTKYGSKAP